MTRLAGFVSALSLSFVLFGCSDAVVGGPGQAGGTLTSGDYDVSTFEVTDDTCRLAVFPENLGEMLLAITVTETQLNVDFQTFQMELAISGGNVSGTHVTQVDYAPSFECVRTQTVTASGTVQANDDFELTADVVNTLVSGAQCFEAMGGVPLPCTSSYALHLAKTPDPAIP